MDLSKISFSCLSVENQQTGEPIFQGHTVWLPEYSQKWDTEFIFQPTGLPGIRKKSEQLNVSLSESVSSQQVREVWCRKAGTEVLNLGSWIWEYLPHFHHLRKLYWITSVYTFSPSFTTAWLEFNPSFQMALRPGYTWTLLCLKKKLLNHAAPTIRLLSGSDWEI